MATLTTTFSPKNANCNRQFFLKSSPGGIPAGLPIHAQVLPVVGDRQGRRHQPRDPERPQKSFQLVLVVDL